MGLNISNHSRIIDFYKELITNDSSEQGSPLPYYYLLDNLISDHRIKEAKKYLDKYKKLPGHKPFLISVYMAHIALAEFDVKTADSIIEAAADEFSEDGGFMFEAAQYYARKCEYEKAIEYYEASYECEAKNKPRYMDALQGIAVIYEIIGENGKAAATYDRILDNLKNEWGFSEEVFLHEAESERNRLIQKSQA